MPLEVVCFCSYLVTENRSAWRPQDQIATKFVKALKGETLKGYAYVPVLGSRQYLGNGNLDDSIEWFGDMVASYMHDAGIEPPFALVPVPNSSATSKLPRPRTHKLARAIARRIGAGAVVADCLRWKRDLGSTRKGTGGTRDAATLYANLVLIEDVDDTIPHILIDDAVASGGHLRACAAKLRVEGASVVKAFCGGITVHEPPDSAFPYPPFEREDEDYEP